MNIITFLVNYIFVSYINLMSYVFNYPMILIKGKYAWWSSTFFS